MTEAIKTQPLISIVTVCYQDMSSVVKTCASIAAQLDVESVEHLLIDGGSSDGTQSWYDQNRPLHDSVLISEPDKGIFDAMNKGIAHAQGQYVGFLNAGDTFSDHLALKRIAAGLKDGSCEWMYSRANVVDTSGRQVRNVVGRVPYSKIIHALGFATICHQTVYMKRSFLQDLGGFDLRFETAADYHLLLRAGRQANPTTRPDLDVLYEAGGVSDVDVYRQLFRRHRARVSALQLGPVGRTADTAWTVLQVVVVRLRKLLKPLLRKSGVKRFLGKVVA